MRRFAAFCLVVGSFAAAFCFLEFRPHHLPDVRASSEIQPVAIARTNGSGAVSQIGSSQGVAAAPIPKSHQSAPSPSTVEDPSRRKPWDTNFLDSIRNPYTDQPVRFDLPGGEIASGKISHWEFSGDRVTYLAGNLSEPESGRFFFAVQTLPGVAGPCFGVMEFPRSKRAYRVEPNSAGGAELVKRQLGSVLCLELPQPIPSPSNSVAEIPPLNLDDFPDVPIPDYQQGIMVLESMAGAKAVIYLDFQGGFTPAWGGIAYQRSGFSPAQIREIWQRVAEDYLPFNINVTTDLRAYERAVPNSRQRVIITPTETAQPGAGGAAYVGSFNSSVEIPCWVFVTNSARYCAQACSHEAGHGLGLVHNGQYINGAQLEYYYGHGSGETSWAPIMGVAYYQNVSQWSRGEYPYANNLQDQLTMIASQNNVHYRSAKPGDPLSSPCYLEIYEGYSASGQGVILKAGQADNFQFTTRGGPLSLRVDPAKQGPNLAVRTTLRDSAGVLFVSNNPQSVLWAVIDTNLAAGTYTLRVEGAGRNDPSTNGFSDYGSIGYYSITGSVANAILPDRFAIPENAPDGVAVGALSSSNPSGTPLNFTIRSGNIGNTFAVDSSGVLLVANHALLDYETLAQTNQYPVQFELFMDILDSGTARVIETNRRVVVAITNVNEAPTLRQFAVRNALYESFEDFPRFSASVVEHAPPGTQVGRLVGSDQDFHTLLSYSVVAGDDGNMFKLDEQSGAITVAGDPTAANQSLYNLTVVVSDQTLPNPLMATSMVSISVELPFQRGTIACAVYTNISGNLVSDLTDASCFPTDPAFEQRLAACEWSSIEPGECGTVMRGYLLPPVTGDYTFWIASQDNGELWLGASTNPVSSVRIAAINGDGAWAGSHEWTKYASQQSSPCPLRAGLAYYFEARAKAGTGTNRLAVAWECAERGIAQQVIPGPYLAPFLMNYQPHPIPLAAFLHRDAIAGARLSTVALSDANTLDQHTFAITAGNPGDLFFIDSVTGDLHVNSDAALLDPTRTNYMLQVRANDNGDPPLSATTSVTVTIVAPESINTPCLQAEIWTNVAGSNLLSLTSLPIYPKLPNVLRPLHGFDTGTNNLVELRSLLYPRGQGTRIRAWLTPTNTGPYHFFISSENDSSLLFSFNTNAAEAKEIAYVEGGGTGYCEWNKYWAQQSGIIWLNAGYRYYLEARQKADSPWMDGNPWGSWVSQGHVEVGWTGPGLGDTTNIIADAFLSPIDINFAPEFADQSVKLPITTENGAVVATLAASDSPADIVAYRIVSGNLSNAFAINPRTGELTVADNTVFASYAVSNFSLVVQAQDSGYGGLYPLRSTLATVSLSVVDNAPAAVWTGNGGNNAWSTASNWDVAPPKDKSKLTFVGANQLTNHNDLMAIASLVSFKTKGFRIEGNPLVLRGGISNIGAGGTNVWAIDSTLDHPQSFTADFGTLVVAGSVKNGGNLLTALVQSVLQFDGNLSGTGGLTKSGTGTLIMSAANAYTGPTHITVGRLALTDSGNLAASSMIKVESGAVLDVSRTSSTYTVPAGQMLSINGTIIGPLIVNGTLTCTSAPSVFPPTLPLLTVSNRLVLAGKMILEIRISPTLPYSQNLKVAGTLECGGTLTVTMPPFQAVTAGRTYKLFDAAQFTGSFASLDLPAGVQWDTSRLTVDGTIRAVRLGATPPTILPATVTNGVITLQFASAAGLHYVPESTSSLLPPIHWVPGNAVTGTGGILSLRFPVQSGAPARFFRVRVY